VSDVDAAERHLRANGTVITKATTDNGPLRYCIVADPDGYEIEVLQIRK
jgi:predicted enzyme related to lactoylglutathione lyase